MVAAYRNKLCDILIAGRVLFNLSKSVVQVSAATQLNTLILSDWKASEQRHRLWLGGSAHLHLHRTRESSSVDTKKDKWRNENH